MPTRTLHQLVTSAFPAVIAVSFFAAATGAAPAQSLDAKHPTPLAAGENTGTVDSMIGPQYWSFLSKAGTATITIRFASMGVFGNARSTTIHVVLHDPTGKTFASQSVTSTGKPVEVKWPGTFRRPTAITLEIRPPAASLVRAGGDYSLTVSGAANFSSVKAAGPEQIAGSYTLMACQPTVPCQAVRFFANGTVKAADGTSGTWTSFDPAALIYSVKIAQASWSVKLVPGRGLVNTADTNLIVFQAIR